MNADSYNVLAFYHYLVEKINYSRHDHIVMSKNVAFFDITNYARIIQIVADLYKNYVFRFFQETQPLTVNP